MAQPQPAGGALGAPGFTSRVHGIVLTTALAAVAAMLGGLFPVIGGPVLGILLGLLVQATGRVGAAYRPGITFCSKQVLQYAIVLLGAGLTLGQVVTIGAETLWVMLSSVIACLLVAALAGRLLGIRSGLTTLIGAGTAICGASAIAAVSSVMESEEKDVAYSISTIFAFNVAAVLIFPLIGHALSLDQQSFGLFAGSAVNDTSSVVAAAYSYGPEAGAYATVVKLTRSTLIVPIVLALAWWRTKSSQEGAAKVNPLKLLPWFLGAFLAAACLNSLGLLPGELVGWGARAGKFLIVVALTAVGLSAQFGQMVRTGLKPLFLGFLLWVTVAVTSLAAQYLGGQL